MANEFKIKKGLIVQGSGSTILDIQGSQGQLFSVTDNLSGSLFSVNDISGLPIFKVSSDDSVKLGTFNAEAIKVSGSSAIMTGSLFGTSSYARQALSASWAPGGGGTTITTQEEGSTLSSTVTTLNFVGAGVTATGAGATTTITIPGGGAGTGPSLGLSVAVAMGLANSIY